MNIAFGFGIGLLAASAALPQAPAPAAPMAPAAPRARTAQQLTVLNASPGSYLGIGMADINGDRAKALKLKEDRGAEVTRVEDDSPAAKAGLKVGDVVLEYNGQKVEGTEELARMVHETPPDRQVKIVVSRDGATQTLTAAIGTRKTSPQSFFSVLGPHVMGSDMPQAPQIPMPDIPSFQMNWRNPRLGIMGEALGHEPQLADFFGVKEGVLVKAVDKYSAAEKAGIKAGDVVTKVGDSSITTTDEITRALRQAMQPGKSAVDVVVMRNKKETTVSVTIENPGSGYIPNVMALSVSGV
ncbi:MAG TPA: PDZ domain-containing protein [Bryobacteraceae bacterium]|nr:PDZ domain-containing protein [Bryobacteraceae bacterium]